MDSSPRTNFKDCAWPWKFLKEESFGERFRGFVIIHCVQTFFWLVDEVTELSLGILCSACIYHLQLGRSLRVPAEALKDIVISIPWGGSRTLPLVSFFFFFFNWRLITLQYCGGFCHTFTWISHGRTCVPHPDPPSHLPPHPIRQVHPSAPALSTLPHAWTWTGDLFHIW